jgi:hypothetical protein
LPLRTGLTTLGQVGADVGLPDQAVTLATVLRAQVVCDYPQDWIDKTGPRNLVHTYATDVDDPAVQPRWGKIGKQRIVDEGPLARFPNMTGLQNWQESRRAKYDMGTFGAMCW